MLNEVIIKTIDNATIDAIFNSNYGMFHSALWFQFLQEKWPSRLKTDHIPFQSDPNIISLFCECYSWPVATSRSAIWWDFSPEWYYLYKCTLVSAYYWLTASRTWMDLQWSEIRSAYHSIAGISGRRLKVHFMISLINNLSGWNQSYFKSGRSWCSKTRIINYDIFKMGPKCDKSIVLLSEILHNQRYGNRLPFSIYINTKTRHWIFARHLMTLLWVLKWIYFTIAENQWLKRSPTRFKSPLLQNFVRWNCSPY